MKKSMKKAFAVMLTMLALPMAMQAQAKFHDVEANDATGPVKSIEMSVMGNPQTVTFSQDGKMQREGMKDVVYDADGYMQSATMEFQGNEMTMNYTWENGKLKSQSMESGMGSMKQSYVYDDKGVLVKQVMDFGGQEMEMPYSDYKYDERGNWISRKTTMMGQEMELTRTITYYE